MNVTATVNHPWSQPESLETMAHMQNNELEEFGNLLDFGDIDLNTVTAAQFAEAIQQQAEASSHPNTPFDGISPIAPPPGTAAQDFGGQEQYGLPPGMDAHQQHFMSPPMTQAPTSVPFTPEAMYQASMRPPFTPAHAHQFQYPPQQAFPPDTHVPPTPNSFNMHGDAGRFMQQHQQQQPPRQLDPQQQAILEQRFQVRKDDAMAFTPMASPAGTPQYPVQPEFTIPGAYFSPLTSPMLHAQSAAQAPPPQHLQGYYTNPSTAPNSNATSPIDHTVDVDMVDAGITLPEAVTSHPRKPKKTRAMTSRSAGPSARVSQSPIQKPQKRKSGTMLSSVVPSRDAAAFVAEAQKSATLPPGSAGFQIPPGLQGSSEDGSISPEPLSESLMGPPPRPGSTMHPSPMMTAQQHQDVKPARLGTAATPKSLLSRNGGQQAFESSSTQNPPSSESDAMADLQLPEAARRTPNRPLLTQINTEIAQAGSSDATPRMSARKTPKLGPLSTPSSTRPASALPSPSAVASPVSATTPGALLKDRKPDTKNGRMVKKRGSMGASNSALASPALRPRISPSIKPLLPEGSTLTSSTHALLLASKSNYQNLLEGNHLPGVTYPDSLSTGLTSKRTSHKVAEQGRRNRINEALKEMQSLLPREYLNGKIKGTNTSDENNSPEAGCAGDGEGKDGKESKEESSAKSNSSKAATVESANVYIKNMQRRQAEEAAENMRLRRRLEEMERKLRDAQCGSGSGTGEEVEHEIDSGPARGTSEEGMATESSAGAVDSPVDVKVQQ